MESRKLTVYLVQGFGILQLFGLKKILNSWWRLKKKKSREKDNIKQGGKVIDVEWWIAIKESEEEDWLLAWLVAWSCSLTSSSLASFIMVMIFITGWQQTSV